MTYGIRIDGTDGSNVFQVIDSDENQDSFQVVATGTGTSVNINDSAYGGATGTKTLFFNPIADVTTVSLSGSTYTFKKYATTEDGSGNKTNATVTNQTVDWILIKNSKDSPLNTSFGNYGIQVFKSTGAISFDSRRMNSNQTFRVLGTAGERTVAGDDQTSAASIVQFDAASTDIFVSADNCYYVDNGTSGEVLGYAIAGTGASSFLRNAFYFWSYTGGGGRTDITRYYSNPYPIIYGEKR